MELKEMIKVMQHFADGGEVEFRCECDDSFKWYFMPEPTWDWSNRVYRIKKQKVTIEKWLCKDKKDNYIIIEGSNVDIYLFEKVKLLETYEVDL